MKEPEFQFSVDQFTDIKELAEKHFTSKSEIL
jgi:hypothetical protein